MFPQLFGTMSNVGQAYQMLALGNYGYGVYSQDVRVRRDRFTGQANVERELEFVPLGPSMFGPSGGLPLGLHQTYYSEGVDIPVETCECLFW